VTATAGQYGTPAADPAAAPGAAPGAAPAGLPAAHPAAAHPAAGGQRSWAGELVRAAAAPVICAAALIGLLSAWVSIGGAGTVSRVRIQVTLAAIPMTSFAASRDAAAGRAGAYLTIRNRSGSADELTGASSPAASRVILTRPAAGGALGAGPGAGVGSAVAGLRIPAHGAVTLTPFGVDVVLIGAAGLRAGQHVPLALVFRQAGRVTIEATVTPPGAP
jgi:copper(I)-binding protein